MIKKLFICANALFVMALLSQSVLAYEDQLQRYRQQGASTPDTQRGKQLWYAEQAGRSCTRCHGEAPEMTGRHARTGKSIDPMALSVNPRRFGDIKKVEKWFFRNCKWTFGRQCSVQDKADILAWLSAQ